MKLLMTLAEASNALGVSRSMLYEQMACGAIRAVKVSGKTMFRPADLEAYATKLPVYVKRSAIRKKR